MSFVIEKGGTGNQIENAGMKCIAELSAMLDIGAMQLASIQQEFTGIKQQYVDILDAGTQGFENEGLSFALDCIRYPQNQSSRENASNDLLCVLFTEIEKDLNFVTQGGCYTRNFTPIDLMRIKQCADTLQLELPAPVVLILDKVIQYIDLCNIVYLVSDFFHNPDNHIHKQECRKGVYDTLNNLYKNVERIKVKYETINFDKIDSYIQRHVTIKAAHDVRYFTEQCEQCVSPLFLSCKFSKNATADQIMGYFPSLLLNAKLLGLSEEEINQRFASRKSEWLTNSVINCFRHIQKHMQGFTTVYDIQDFDTYFTYYTKLSNCIRELFPRISNSTITSKLESIRSFLTLQGVALDPDFLEECNTILHTLEDFVSMYSLGLMLSDSQQAHTVWRNTLAKHIQEVNQIIDMYGSIHDTGDSSLNPSQREALEGASLAFNSFFSSVVALDQIPPFMLHSVIETVEAIEKLLSSNISLHPRISDYIAIVKNRPEYTNQLNA